MCGSFYSPSRIFARTHSDPKRVRERVPDLEVVVGERCIHQGVGQSRGSDARAETSGTQDAEGARKQGNN